MIARSRERAWIGCRTGPARSHGGARGNGHRPYSTLAPPPRADRPELSRGPVFFGGRGGRAGTAAVAAGRLVGLNLGIVYIAADWNRHTYAGGPLNGLRQRLQKKGTSSATRPNRRTCPACGFIDQRNRPAHASFRCIGCGCAGPADTLAAGPIARRAGVQSAACGISLGDTGKLRPSGRGH
jgi:hypothetical protein